MKLSNILTIAVALCVTTFAMAQESAELLSTGYVFTEGPVWCEDSNILLFSDIRGDAIHQWSAEAGASLFHSPSQFTNGNTYDGENFYICRYTTRDIAKMDKSGNAISIVDNFEGKRFNSPNDIIVSKLGSLYFVDPEFGLKDKTQKEIPFHGLYHIARDSNKAEAVDSTLLKPNGVALSPDQRILYLCETQDNILYTYQLDENGAASNRELFCNVSGEGSLDGLACHGSGYLFVALGKGGIAVISPEGVEVDRITFSHGESTRNCCFDGEDNMYITAGKSLYKYVYDFSRIGL
ncbi:MAG: SMP-30/gluconolactonase/LRE family protein [Rikenellaceae bacterium]